MYMNKILLIFAITILTLIASCKKETTIKEEYNPPQPKLYGTWQVISVPPSTSNSYYVFPNDASNFGYILTIDKDGFKSQQTFTYKATENQINMYYYLYNYTVANDTMKMFSAPGVYSAYVKISNPAFTKDNWNSTFSSLKRLTPPRGFTTSTSRSFGINGDFIYPNGMNGSGTYVYKYNTLTQQYIDSISVSANTSTYFKSPSLYYGLYGNFMLYKTADMSPSATPISTNLLNYCDNVSANASSGVIYAFLSNAHLYSGTEGSNFNDLFDLTSYSVSNVLYYKNDEFLGLKGGYIIRFKISPKFTILDSYLSIPNFNVYALSSNGSDTWVYGYNYAINDYQLMKIN